MTHVSFGHTLFGPIRQYLRCKAPNVSSQQTFAAGNTQEIRNTERSTLISSLLTDLECPVCYLVKGPPIYICKNGHNVCEDCRLQLTECAMCRLPGRPEIRNRCAEDIYKKLTVPCDNSIRGCKQRLLPTPDHTLEHSLVCSYALEKCLLCPYSGTPEELIAHLESTHPSVERINFKSRSIRTVPLGNFSKNQITLMHRENQLFWLLESYKAETQSFFAQILKNGPKIGRYCDFVCTMRFGSEDFNEELTYCSAIPLARDFFELAMENRFSVRTKDGVMHYSIDVTSKGHKKDGSEAKNRPGELQHSASALFLTWDPWILVLVLSAAVTLHALSH